MSIKKVFKEDFKIGHFKRYSYDIIDKYNSVNGVLATVVDEEGKRKTAIYLESDNATELKEVTTKIDFSFEELHPSEKVSRWLDVLENDKRDLQSLGKTTILHTQYLNKKGRPDGSSSGHFSKEENSQSNFYHWVYDFTKQTVDVVTTVSSCLVIKPIVFDFQNHLVTINIGRILSWEQLCRELQIVHFQSKGLKRIDKIVYKESGLLSEIHEICLFKESVRYVINPIEIHNLQDFYNELEKRKGDSALSIVKSAFGKENIGFDELMAADELAMTDEILEKIGIKQIGLRIAILLLIKNNK